ncbi:MAG: hypothetical protein UT63_C0009G0009 [Candidatus Gottesmanbacteria bacterium GW2011_GWC2_39_8]|uniref:Uncharacterized protein n=1 Tax=Candidatus Gottesmanbacteria bacterium GW2011_GWC2_39_8 TaxID=1618450 RepID=A0A0G0Q0V4_9BACT|nr:MAG: hypothetical protein UT63_C0009G0009 [Candidatus Gottesmanbacteria bacterium GW2011_GWC2_39_8]
MVWLAGLLLAVVYVILAPWGLIVISLVIAYKLINPISRLEWIPTVFLGLAFTFVLTIADLVPDLRLGLVLCVLIAANDILHKRDLDDMWSLETLKIVAPSIILILLNNILAVPFLAYWAATYFVALMAWQNRLWRYRARGAAWTE